MSAIFHGSLDLEPVYRCDDGAKIEIENSGFDGCRIDDALTSKDWKELLPSLATDSCQCVRYLCTLIDDDLAGRRSDEVADVVP